MYDDFIFRGKNCRELGAHAFFGESSTVSATIARNLYELPGGQTIEIGDASIKSVTQKVTLAPLDGMEATDAWVRRLCGWLGGGRGRLTVERDPARWRLCSFDKAAVLDNKDWPDGCLQVQATLYGMAEAVRPTTISAATSGGAAALVAAIDTDVAVPVRVILRVTGGTVTAATIACGGQTLRLSGFSAGAGTEIIYDAGAQGAPELRIGGALRFDTVSAWRRLKAGRGERIAVELTGGEADVTAQLYGRWFA